MPLNHTDLERVDFTPSASQKEAAPGPSNSNDKGRRLSSLMVGLAVIVVAGVGAFYFMDRNGISLKSNISSVEFLGTVSVTELEMHDVPEDCWLAMHGHVYDLTEYAPEHPGGTGTIYPFCGIDATRAYDREHSESLLQTIDFLKLGVYTEEPQPAAGQSIETVQRGDPTGAAPSSAGNPSSSSSAGYPASSPAVPVPAPYVLCSSDSEDDDEEEEGCKEPAADQQAQPVPVHVPSPASTPAAQGGPSSPQAGGSTTNTCQQQFYTIQNVQAHADRFDCWYVLYDAVYDLTDYAAVHPGGDRIVTRECGTDATAAYAAISKHNQRLLAKERMNRYKIGLLGQQSGLFDVPCS